MNKIKQKLSTLNWTAYKLAKETGCKERMAYKLANGEASFTASLFCGLYLDKLIKEEKNV